MLYMARILFRLSCTMAHAGKFPIFFTAVFHITCPFEHTNGVVMFCVSGPCHPQDAGDSLVPTARCFRFLASQRDWVPQNEAAEGAQAAAAAAAAAAKGAAEAHAVGEKSFDRTGRMRVEGSLVEVKVRISRRRNLRFPYFSPCRWRDCTSILLPASLGVLSAPPQ